MSPSETLNIQTFAAYLETLDMNIGGEAKQETLRGAESTSPEHPVYSLPRITFTREETEEAEIKLEKMLGVGGMGEVWKARQVPLRRKVAVKRLHSGAKNPMSIQRNLLREAWTAGRLEHPNIVPVHALGVDEEDRPLLVMKLVQGSDWRELIYCPWMMPKRYEGRTPSDVHLEILMKLCDAVHFAHSRGVIHRDLKPENVMVGDYGEVYLLDWGIAAGLDNTEFEEIPKASEVVQPVGTPGYMAPEMVYPELGPLGVHSDVYCLGAILHEVLTGTLRHPGDTTEQVFLHTFNTQPVRYPEDTVPKRLADICNRATSLEPADRYPSANALRLDIEQYLLQRDSLALVETALTRLTQLEKAVASREDHLVGEVYGAVEFGLRQALDIWPDNVDARDAQQRLHLMMARFELQREQPAMGRGHLQRLRNIGCVNTSDLDVLENKLNDLEKTLARRAELSREMDVRVFTRRRTLFVAALIVPIFLIPFLRHFSPPTTRAMVIGQGVMAIVTLGLIGLNRRWLLGTIVNRSLASYLVSGTILVLMLRLMAHMRALSIHVLSLAEFLLFIGIFMFLPLLADKRLFVPFLLLALPLFAYVTFFEGSPFLATAFLNGGCLLAMIVVWSKKQAVG